MVEHSSPNGSLTSERVDVLLVCSTGGHLLQLLALRGAWAEFSRVWVTFDKSDARSLLADEQVVFAHGPTNRNFGLLAVKNLVLNLVAAVRLLRSVRPKVVLTTGAGVAVPFAWIGRVLGARVVYVESLTRIERPSLSCRLIAPVASRIYAQWPELRKAVPKARYVGSVVSGT
jgi:UDP-N-acetylglucosamine:LPS N-acetylglucosamine transferase